MIINGKNIILDRLRTSSFYDLQRKILKIRTTNEKIVEQLNSIYDFDLYEQDHKEIKKYTNCFLDDFKTTTEERKIYFNTLNNNIYNLKYWNSDLYDIKNYADKDSFIKMKTLNYELVYKFEKMEILDEPSLKSFNRWVKIANID